MLKSEVKEIKKSALGYPKLMKSVSGGIYLMSGSGEGTFVAGGEAYEKFIGRVYRSLDMNALEDFTGTVTLTGE